MIKDAWLKFNGESRPAYENFNAGYNAGWEHAARIERRRAAKLIEALENLVSECRAHKLMLSEMGVNVAVSWTEFAQNVRAEYEATATTNNKPSKPEP